VTLVEVLVSVFVLAVGLIGVASMLPIASRYSSDANQYDRGATLAQAVGHDALLHGDLFPKTWLDTFVPLPGLAGHYAVNVVGANSYLFSTAAGAAGTQFLPPVIIDPLGVSYAALKGQTPPPLFPAFPVTTFPPGQQLAGAPAIFRLTLDSTQWWPSEDQVPPIPPVGMIPLPPAPMQYFQADRLFRSNDDMLFRSPSNKDLRPVSQSMPTNGSQSADYQWAAGVLTATGNNAGNLGQPTPNYEGDYSWLLTVAFDVDDLFNADVANATRFSVSVVVIKNRDLNLDQTGATLDFTKKNKPPSERMVFADLLDASAQATAAGAALPFGINYSGGAVRLRTPAPSATSIPQVTASWLDVKPNEWLMLSAFMYDRTTANLITAPDSNVVPPPLPLPVPFVQWYRIAGVGDTVDISGNGSGPWYRDVQLAGPDWNNANFAPNSYTYPAPIVPNTYAVQYQFATLISGTVAVYNNMMFIDGSLLKD
jgi:hypothetical protein